MFARASCEDGDRSVYFASVRFESASTPLYHEFPFLLPVTGHRFPSVTDSSTNLVFHDDATQTWYNFAYVIWDNIPSSMMTIVERIVETANHLQRDHLQRDPSISRRIEERNLTIVQRGQPIRIPRRNCRDYSMFPSNSRSKSSIDPRKIHRFPPRIARRSSTSTRVTWSPTSICHSHVECWRRPRNYWPFDVSIESATSKRTRQWLIDEAIDSTRFEQVTRSRRGTPACLVPLLSPCSLYACLFNRRYPLSSNYTIDPARSRRDVSSCYIFRSPLPSAR